LAEFENGVPFAKGAWDCIATVFPARLYRGNPQALADMPRLQEPHGPSSTEVLMDGSQRWTMRDVTEVFRGFNELGSQR